MSRTNFNKSKYPFTINCQVLDSQISGLRSDKDEVFRGLMRGNKREVKDILLEKEIQFVKQNCSKKLEDSSVYGTIDMTQQEFKELEERIIQESDKKRQVMLIGGGVVLLIALVIFIK